MSENATKQLIQSIFSCIKTTDDVALMQQDIAHLKQQLFDIHIDSKKVLETIGSPNLKLYLSPFFVTKWNQEKSDAVMQTIQLLVEELPQLPVVMLTIAITPPPHIVDSISAWIKSNFGETTVVKITVNETILGGAQITYKGLYKDYSLKTEIAEFLAHKRQEIIQNLN